MRIAYTFSCVYFNTVFLPISLYIQDIVTENSQSFDLDSFIPLLRERIYANDSFSRQFIISWVSVLNAVPEINMIVYLPEILDGLFQMLQDHMVEIHRMCETLLSQFLKSIQSDPAVADMPKMSNILVGHAQSSNELIQVKDTIGDQVYYAFLKFVTIFSVHSDNMDSRIRSVVRTEYAVVCERNIYGNFTVSGIRGRIKKT